MIRQLLGRKQGKKEHTWHSSSSAVVGVGVYVVNIDCIVPYTCVRW